MKRAFLDDVRLTPGDCNITWRDADEAVSWMEENGCPSFISFDHDLGEEQGGYSFKLKPTGLDVVKWMVERDIESPGFIPKDFDFDVHSANPVGAKNIRSYLKQYLSMRES